MKIIKLVVLINNQILISEIEEVTSELGEPDCKLISPYMISDFQNFIMEPFLNRLTKKNVFMISSDKIITLTDPTPTLLEKYEDLTKE